MLGSELRAIRETRGLTVRDLAERADVSPEAVSAIERGARYPNLRTLEQIAEVLRIRIIIGPSETVIEPEL